MALATVLATRNINEGVESLNMCIQNIGQAKSVIQELNN